MNDAPEDRKHILIVSAEPLVLAEIKMELIDAFHVSIAATSATALSALDKYKISAIIIYIGGDRDSAFTVFSDISAYVKNEGIPVLFLAENGNNNDETEAFSAGAVDYAVRRSGRHDAFVHRVNLRIYASDILRRVQRGEPEQEAPQAVTPETVLADKTILVVDDVELNRDLIEGMLCGISGLTLEFAGDGDEAVQKYMDAPDRYSLILMDVQMPVMNGTDATKAIRVSGHKNARDIPIIALTAGTEERDIAAYLASGMSDYLKKPMDYDLLLNTVSKYCIS